MVRHQSINQSIDSLIYFNYVDTELIISFITDVQVGLGDTWTVRFTIKPLQAQPIPLSLITYVYNEMGPLGFSGNHALQIIEEIYGYTNEVSSCIIICY